MNNFHWLNAMEWEILGKLEVSNSKFKKNNVVWKLLKSLFVQLTRTCQIIFNYHVLHYLGWIGPYNVPTLYSTITCFHSLYQMHIILHIWFKLTHLSTSPISSHFQLPSSSFYNLIKRVSTQSYVPNLNVWKVYLASNKVMHDIGKYQGFFRLYYLHIYMTPSS